MNSIWNRLHTIVQMPENPYTLSVMMPSLGPRQVTLSPHCRLRKALKLKFTLRAIVKNMCTCPLDICFSSFQWQIEIVNHRPCTSYWHVIQLLAASPVRFQYHCTMLYEHLGFSCLNKGSNLNLNNIRKLCTKFSQNCEKTTKILQQKYRDLD